MTKKYIGPKLLKPLAQMMTTVEHLAAELDKVSLPPMENEHAWLYMYARGVVDEIRGLIELGYLPSPAHIAALQNGLNDDD